MEDKVYVNPHDGEMYSVHQIDDMTNTEWIEDDYYIIGQYLYRFIGKDNRLSAPKGTIYVDGGIISVQYYDEDDEEAEAYHISHIRTKSRYKKMMSWGKGSLDDIADGYISMSNNAMDNYNVLANTGSIYVPELKDDDDPMERVMKLMIISMKLKLNEKRGTTEKEYAIDNLRSALNGATKNMSILKFLMWCDVLHLDWEFSLINDPSAKPMLNTPVVISSNKPLDIKIPETNPDNKIFWVPLVEGEDPLKRLIKIALWVLQVNLKDYRNKGTSSHCINNLRSGLKGKQKMSIQGMLKWCEILDLILVIKVTNPETGYWYKSVGYSVSTNVPDDEHASYVEEK